MRNDAPHAVLAKQAGSRSRARARHSHKKG
jgi:hypothetical protein